jgi:predicted HicB family RNase H-like nuclease
MKPRGRPKVDPADRAPSVNVNWRLSQKSYDQMTQRATAARQSLPEYVRRLLSEKIDPRP